MIICSTQLNFIYLKGNGDFMSDLFTAFRNEEENTEATVEVEVTDVDETTEETEEPETEELEEEIVDEAINTEFIQDLAESIEEMDQEDIVFIECLKIMARNSWKFVPLHMRSSATKNAKVISDLKRNYYGNNDELAIIDKMFNEVVQQTRTINHINTIISIFE